LDKMYKSLFTSDPYAASEVYSAIFNIWICISTVVVLSSLPNNIISQIFYGIPSVIFITIIVGCTVLSCAALIYKKLMKYSIFMSIGLYLWIASSAFRFSPLSLTTGTYFILATRYILVYIKIQARGYSD
jgi:hypothetical protein